MEDFVTYEIAKKLKEKGFNEGCYKYYENKTLKWANFPWLETKYNSSSPHTTAAPTISQVLKWLREEKELHIEIYMCHNCYLYEIYNTKNYDADLSQKREKYSEIEYETYEKAVLDGIEYTLNNLI